MERMPEARNTGTYVGKRYPWSIFKRLTGYNISSISTGNKLLRSGSSTVAVGNLLLGMVMFSFVKDKLLW